MTQPNPINQRYVQSVVLDATGAGSVTIVPRADFACSQTTWRVQGGTGTNQSTAQVELNGDFWQGTYSGNNDASPASRLITNTDIVECDWTGGPPGGTATLTMFGVEYPAGTGIPPPAGNGGPGNPILGGTTLIRDAIQSEDYVPGVSGWSIFRDGSAELNNVVLRGSLLAKAANGSYVFIHNDATGGRIDIRPPDSAGTVITPAEIAATVTNPKSGAPALAVIGPVIDGNGPVAAYFSQSATFGREFFLDADIFWLTSQAVEWSMTNDWEISTPLGAPSPGNYIFFQVRASDYVCDGDSFSGGSTRATDPHNLGITPNNFGGTQFNTVGTTQAGSLTVNFDYLSAKHELSRTQASSATLTATTYQEISTASDLQFSKDCIDGLTDAVVTMHGGCRTTVANTVVQFGVRIKTFAGATIGDIDVFRVTMNTVSAHTYASGIARVTGLSLVQNTIYKAHPIWKITAGTSPTVTMDANDTLSLQIEEKSS